MAQTCGICKHPQRDEIEKALVGNIPYRRIAEPFRVSISALSRHRHHIPEGLLGAARAAKNQEENELVRACSRLLADVSLLSRKVRHSGKRNTVEAGKLLLQLSRETREILLLRSRLSGPRPSTNGRAGTSPQELTESGETEMSEAEADEIARKWIARRESAFPSTPNAPAKSRAQQGVEEDCPSSVRMKEAV